MASVPTCVSNCYTSDFFGDVEQRPHPARLSVRGSLFRFPTVAKCGNAMTPDEFVQRWEKSGGAELANSQSFLKELCELLGVAQPGRRPHRPDPARTSRRSKRSRRVLHPRQQNRNRIPPSHPRRRRQYSPTRRRTIHCGQVRTQLDMNTAKIRAMSIR